MPARLLLIGGSGLIGSCMQDLIRERYSDLRVLNIEKPQIDLRNKYCVEALREVAKDFSPSNIVILAATKRQDGDSEEAFAGNEAITENIADAISGCACHVTYISSCAVYGEQNEQIGYTEESLVMPTSMYGRHKANSERLYSATLSHSGLLIIRPPVIYGDSTTGYNPAGLLTLALESKPIVLWGDGLEKREFIHVTDASSAILELAMREKNGLYNLVSGTSWSYRQIADSILEHIPACVISRPRSGRKIDHTYDASLLNSTLSSHPQFMSPIEYIEKTVSGIKANG